MEGLGIIGEHMIYKDNTSSKKLENNGKVSSGKRKKPMNVVYFFIKGRIYNRDFKIEHCPIKEMWGDCCTEPLY